MIQVNGICKFYGNKKAVENLSFEIREGEIIGLLGLNGAGKSTILKILACFLRPSSGDARIGNISLSDDAQRVREIIGYLSDTPPLYDEMTVESYLRFVARLKNVPKSDLSESVQDAIVKTNLGDVRAQVLQELSHGYRQRVGIAQALVHRPKILILDEPINGLDPVQIAEMRDLILSLKGQHTVILSSHILSEITKTCDRILVIDNGRLVAEGSEEDLLAQGDANVSIKMEAIVGEEFVQNLRKADHIQNLNAEIQGQMTIFDIQTDEDIRANLAEMVVSSGGELLTLQRNKAELENLFFKLINSES